MSASRPGFTGLVGFELRKFALRPLPWCLFLLIAGVTLLLGLIRRADGGREAESWALYAYLIARTMPLAAFVAMILGTLAVNHELGAGSLRALLLRPVHRREVILAKGVLIAAFALAAGAIALLSALLFTAAVSDLGAITIEIEGLAPHEVVSAPAMRAYATKLAFAALLPVLASATFGLLVSVLVESEGSAVAGAIVLYLAMQVLGTAAPEAAAWLFPSYLELDLALLGELAHEDSSRVAQVDALGALSRSYLAPLGMALLFVLASVVVFERKELPC